MGSNPNVVRRTFTQWVARHRGKILGTWMVGIAICGIGDVNWDAILWPTGIFIVGAGIAIRIWARQHIRDVANQPIGLAREGPYTLVRHPLYIGNSALFVGCAVLSELLWAIPLTLALCALLYSVAARREESRCLAKYGQAYHEYMETVPRWLPRTKPNMLTGFVTDRWQHAARAEWACLLLVPAFLMRDLLLPTLLSGCLAAFGF